MIIMIIIMNMSKIIFKFCQTTINFTIILQKQNASNVFMKHVL